MKRPPATFVSLGVALFISGAQAQINSPPPTGYVHVFSVPGVVNNGALATFFACTNTGTETSNFAVEVFQNIGFSLNDPEDNALDVPRGATVLFATSGSATFLADSFLPIPIVNKGSARILASSARGIICKAWVADTAEVPPASMTSLPIVPKVKQKR